MITSRPLPGAFLSIVGAAALQLWQGSHNRAGTEEIVRDYILSNPEILPEAMKRLHTAR